MACHQCDLLDALVEQHLKPGCRSALLRLPCSREWGRPRLVNDVQEDAGLRRYRMRNRICSADRNRTDDQLMAPIHIRIRPRDNSSRYAYRLGGRHDPIACLWAASKHVYSFCTELGGSRDG